MKLVEMQTEPAKKILWKPIELSDKAIFDAIGNNGNGIAMFGFSSLFLWKDYYRTTYAVVEGNIVAKGVSDSGKCVIYFPRGLSCNVRKTVETVINDSDLPVRFLPVTESDAEVLANEFEGAEVKELEGKWEYVYLQSDLGELSGKKYHSKRNHIAKFNKNYNSEYIAINKDNVHLLEECAHHLFSVIENSPQNEFVAIKNAIRHFDELCLRACVIKVGGEYVAYSIGSVLNNDTADIHFEKADRNYEGSYAFVNNSFAKYGFSDMKYLNREEDLGIEGLRKAKLSYYPYKFNKTYEVKFMA